MEVLSLASLIALGMSLVSFVKFVRAKDVNSALTMLVSWIIGIALVFVAAESDLFGRIAIIPGVPPLDNINNASKVLIGMMFLSLGREVYQFRKAIDNSQSAEEPAIFPPAKTITDAGEAVTAPGG